MQFIKTYNINYLDCKLLYMNNDTIISVSKRAAIGATVKFLVPLKQSFMIILTYLSFVFLSNLVYFELSSVTYLQSKEAYIKLQPARQVSHVS